MDARGEIRRFLTSRRARISPAEVGLPASTGVRRVPGLRREEAAALAGVSVDYYTRLERGDATGVSDSVLESLGRALRFDAVERAHLAALLRASRPDLRSRPTPVTERVTESVQRVLDSMGTAPAFVSNTRLELVAVNALGAALYDGVLDPVTRHMNLARFVYLDPASRPFYPEWDAVADMTVALLRATSTRDPLDGELAALVAELAAGSEDFRRRWSAHDVGRYTSGRKAIRHPVVGDLELAFDTMELADDATLTLTVYTAAPGSPTDDALRMLASWAASREVAAGSR